MNGSLWYLPIAASGHVYSGRDPGNSAFRTLDTGIGKVANLSSKLEDTVASKPGSDQHAGRGEAVAVGQNSMCVLDEYGHPRFRSWLDFGFRISPPGF
jgi:hypothetical protein